MLASEEFNALNELREKAYKQKVDLMICETL
jgi:sulfur relay (sulfurtransferase) complex TusBCD TusD component (DsrE family)